jgi:hypothetical protein
MSDPNWKYPHQYAEPSAIFEGEIGKIEGVRFIESTEAKVFHAEDLAHTSRNITVTAAAEATDELASNYIPAEVEVELKKQTPYDRIIKIYPLGMYFHDFAKDMTMEEVIAARGTKAEYVTFTTPIFGEEQIHLFRFQNGEEVFRHCIVIWISFP